MTPTRWAPAALLAPACFTLLLLFAAPLGWLLATSLEGPQWAIRQYTRILGSPYYLTTLGRTVLLGASVACATTALGVPMAWWLARLPRRRAALLLALTTIPLWTNAVVRSFAWVVLLGKQGLVSRALDTLGLPYVRLLQTFPAVIVALAQVLLPIVVMALYGTIRGIDPKLEAAARTLGATRLRAAVLVTLPLAWPSIISAAGLAFVLAAGAFTTPNLVGNARVHLLSVAIYERMVELADWPFAAALSTLLLGTVLIVLLAQRRLATRF